MAWIPFRRSLATGNALSETEARVRKGGQVVISRAAAEKIGLKDRAFVLFCPDTIRLAFRKPEDSELRDALRIRPEGDPKSVGLKFVAIDCKAVFRVAGWMATVDRRPGKKPTMRVKYEGRKPLYVRASTADGPGMIVVKLDEDKPDEIEEIEDGGAD